jgi:rhodanese-related sulfurtransferase
MKKIITTLILSLSLAASALASTAFPEISREELKTAVASGKAVLLDVNGTDSYAKAHIPGAIDFSASADKLAELLPADKDALIVAYCGNEKCKAYLQGAEAASKLGYTNVKHYAGGIQGWKKAGEKTEAR